MDRLAIIFGISFAYIAVATVASLLAIFIQTAGWIIGAATTLDVTLGGIEGVMAVPVFLNLTRDRESGPALAG